MNGRVSERSNGSGILSSEILSFNVLSRARASCRVLSFVDVNPFAPKLDFDLAKTSSKLDTGTWVNDVLCRATYLCCVCDNTYKATLINNRKSLPYQYQTCISI